jgi:excisionase family DNA binding protein
MSSNIQFTKICEHCGATFIAQKCSTRFCSKRCAEHAYKRRRRHEHVQTKQAEFDSQKTAYLSGAEFLSPTQCAKLLGVSRRTVYYYLESNQIPCFQFKGMTRIRRSDIEKLFDKSNGYVKRPAKQREEITEFYSTKEVLAKFSISKSWLFQIAKEKQIPKTTHLGKTLWSKPHCDRIFGQKSPDVDEITEWYSAAEVCEKFSMTLGQVYNFVNRHGIPKRKVGNITSYSRKHFDRAKGLAVADEQRWYSYAEAMAKYGLSHDQVGHYIKWHKLTTKKAGKYTYIDADEFDNLMAPPKI